MELTKQISQECLAARKQCVLFDHPNRGIIEVRGGDRIRFLHNILSNDIKSLSAGKGVAACFLNAQAHLIANMNVLCFDQFLWLALDYPLKDKLLESLSKLIITEEVTLNDKSDELKLVSIHGPKAKELLKALFKKDLPNEILGHETVAIDGATAILIRINLTGEIGYGLLTPKERARVLKSAIEKAGIPFGLLEIHSDALEVLRIEAGIPRYGTDFDESHIPLEARLNQTISFTKGCFPGQEIIARLDSRGGVAKKLSGFVLKSETLPKKGDRILKDGVEVGRITSAAFSPILKKTIAMGYLKKEYSESGCPVVVETEKGQIPARVESLPFYS